MKLGPKIKRRVFLGSLFLMGVASLPPRRAGATEGGEPAAERLVALLRHRDSAKRVGREYLKARPQEACAANLVTELTRDLKLPTISDGDLRAHFNKRSKADFRARRVVKLDGWILSETEARLCALTSLI
jgi:hypothetical protein